MGIKQLLKGSMIACTLLFQNAMAQAGMQFTPNLGQWHEKIAFEADILAGKLFLEKTGFTYYMYQGDDQHAYHDIMHKRGEFPKNFTMRGHILKTKFVGSNIPELKGDEPFDFYKNYLIGRDKKHWASHVPVYGVVDYSSVYSGIDLKVYSNQDGLKYDWIIAPNSDPSQIKIEYQGAEDLFINDGQFYIRTSINHLVESPPEAYQIIDGKRIPVGCSFDLNGKVLGYKLGEYNKAYPLVIDPPIMVFATYSGSSADNFGFTATYDKRGSLYAAGNVTHEYSNAPGGKYPSTAGAFQVNPAGFVGTSGPYGFFKCDMAISKYDSSGKKLLWATYLGGTDNDYPNSLVVDSENRLLVLGSTYSADFPVDTSAYDTLHGGKSDIVVVKFSYDGSALLGSTFVGGPNDDGVLDGTALVFNYADNYRGDIQVARNGDIFFASSSKSDTGIFISPDAIQTKNNGGYDGLLVQLDSLLTEIKWSTYYGGKQDDGFYSLRIDRSNNLIAGGGAVSNDLVTTPGSIFEKKIGGIDGMIVRIDPKNKQLLAATYMGTSQYDQVYFVDFDLKNHVYAYGQTMGTFPVVGNPYSYTAGGLFILKMDEELDSVLMSTTLGSRPNDPNLSPTAFLVDNCFNIYFAGWGSDEGGHVGTTTGMPVTPDAIQGQTDGNDFYLGVLDKNAQNLIYATYFGGTQTNDHVDGGTSRFDKRGVVYHSVCGSCPPSGNAFISDIPTTPGAAFPTNLSPRCSNASFKLDFQITYAVESDFTAAPVAGCGPLTVNFTNKSYQGTRFDWVFGDGTTDTGYDAVHTYTQPGKYTAYLRVTDSLSCNTTDSVTVEIEVIISTPADFSYSIEPCGREVTFTMQDGLNAPLGYSWDFGDGTTSTERTPKHEYKDFGRYQVKLITNAKSPCADSIVQEISLNEPASADLKIPNVFTPDGDPLNACYRFDGLRECDEVEVEIYNRYAILIYESEDINFCWDGRDKGNGKLLPAGVYYVIARIRSSGSDWKEYKGTVTMIY